MKYLLCLCLVACGDGPTFMGVCPEGVVIHLPSGNSTVSAACDKPTRITWPSLPLRVSLASNLVDYHNSAQSACDFWNRKVGKQMLVLNSSTDGPADVTVTLGGVRGEVLGTTSFLVLDGRMTATVDLLGPSDITTVYWLLAHEFGHVLGLAHDKAPKSIMSADLDMRGGLMGEDDAIPVFVLTTEDRDALRQVYP